MASNNRPWVVWVCVGDWEDQPSLHQGGQNQNPVSYQAGQTNPVSYQAGQTNPVSYQAGQTNPVSYQAGKTNPV